VHIYFIANNNHSGDGIPTLKRWELGTGFTPLVDGIENMQVVYGIDNDGNGAPDAWTPAPAAVDDWRNVTAAHINLLARNTEPSGGFTDNRSYVLGRDAAGDDVVVGPFNDAYKRHVFATAVELKNPAWRRR